MTPAPPTRHALIAGLVLALLLAVGLLATVRKGGASELRVYVQGAERMLRGDVVYRVGEPKPFTYPPFFALPFVPFTVMPQPLHKPLFFLLNAALLALSVWRLSRWVRPPGPVWPRPSLFWTAVLLVSVWHVNTVFEKQTHDNVVLALLVLAIDASCARRDGRAGAWAGLAAACKATPLLLAAVFGWQRRWLALASMLVVTLTATAAPDVLLPSRDGQSWAVSWYRAFVSGVRPGASAETPGEWTAWNMLNQNLAGSIHRLTTTIPPERETNDAFDVSLLALDPATVRLTTTAAQVLVLGLVLLCCRPALGRGETPAALAMRRVGEGGAALCATVLLSPWSSKTHFGVLLVPAAFCVAHVLYRHRDRVVITLLGVTTLLGVFTAKDVWGRPLVNELLARGLVTWCAVLLLVASVVALLRSAGGRGDHLLAGEDAHWYLDDARERQQS